MKALKGVSARLLMQEYGTKIKEKCWNGKLWNPSYFIATGCDNTKEQIEEYIKTQKKG